METSEDFTASDGLFPERPLNIAVLGPSLDDTRNIGTRKRLQIRDALENDGHRPFFPEERIDRSAHNWIVQERELLRHPSVDMVIILHTEHSWGAFAEIANFVTVPEIQFKTAVLFPVALYTPTQSLPGNILQGYFVRMPYTDWQMEACQLVSECRRWAYDRMNGAWPEFRPWHS